MGLEDTGSSGPCEEESRGSKYAAVLMRARKLRRIDLRITQL